MSIYTIVSFYKFDKLTNIYSLQEILTQLTREQGVLGTIILAQEGINGTIAGKEASIQTILSFLQTKTRLTNSDYKYASSTQMPFNKLKILIKKEIVALKVLGIDPTQRGGAYIAPEAWNDLISDPDTLVIDTRNTYEIELGTFKNALNPNTQTFRDFPTYVKENLNPHKHKKIAMFCTGGIRCEKASAYLVKEGFEQVYQLQGGILNYLEKIPVENSLWEGKCFVFDNRITSDRIYTNLN